MSDAIKDFQENMAKEEVEAKKAKEIRSKRLIIDENRVNREVDRIRQVSEELQKAENTDYSKLSKESRESLRKKNLDYFDGAKHGMEFIHPVFNGIVPFFQKNLILMLAKTGEGKSTAVSNMVLSIIRQKNPVTGAPRRVLVITNEEAEEDVYNRIPSLIKGWAYTNHAKFSDEQINTFDKFIDGVTRSGIINVIGDTYEGNDGTTTTIEGIRSIFDNLIKNKIHYDAIIIDYYQNVASSKVSPEMNEFQAQATLANMLDKYKNIYPAPIVVMAQIKPNDQEKGKENKTPIRLRIEGTKKIINKATFVMEMIPDKTNLRTEWFVHKTRFGEFIGTSLFTGFDRGRFVEYNQAFIDQVRKNKIDKLYARSFAEQETGKPSIPMKDGDKK